MPWNQDPKFQALSLSTLFIPCTSTSLKRRKLGHLGLTTTGWLHVPLPYDIDAEPS